MRDRLRPRRALALLVVLGAPTLLGACGNGTQSKPVALDRDAVPFGLLQSTSTTEPTTTLPAMKYPFVVYFEGADGIAQAIRTANEPANARLVADALLAGPTREETQIGMRSAIPPRSIAHVERVAGRMITVDLRPAFLEISGAEQKVALTQIVFTMTRLQHTMRVKFLLDGQPVSVLRANGTVTRQPVTRGDYTTTHK